MERLQLTREEIKAGHDACVDAFHPFSSNRIEGFTNLPWRACNLIGYTNGEKTTRPVSVNAATIHGNVIRITMEGADDFLTDFEFHKDGTLARSLHRILTENQPDRSI